jgi:hypothetical protein
MSLLARLDLRELTPSRLWGALDPETRRLAAETNYEVDDESARLEADMAIAAALRYRPQAVRKLPASKRVGYLLRAVRPGDSLASSLLLALHLGHRAPMLAAFLDRLGIEHEDGAIRDDKLEPPAAESLAAAVTGLYERFPREDVDLYLSALIALDQHTWVHLPEAIERLS